jgi:ribonuclease BN (tRNA processing enzyme)
VSRTLPDGSIDRIIIDSGNGIINLGRDILANFGKECLDPIMILFTHLHPDHTMEFPFFAPNYVRGAKISLYGMEALKNHVGKILERNMLPPNFPIEYKDLKSKRQHYIVKDGSKLVSPGGTMSIECMQSYAPSHPQQGCIYYRITDISSNKSIAIIWDLESKKGGDRAVINFAKDCDCMAHDTHYTEEEYHSDSFIVQGFGHSTYDMAVENAVQAGLKSALICTHFNPAHDDNKLAAIESQIKNKFSDCRFSIHLAKTGMVHEV